MDISNRIRALRLERGLTQEALAAEMGVSPQSVSKWERGAALPDISMLPELSVFFGVSLDELFGLTDDKEYDRIQNMLWDKRVLSQSDIDGAVRWIDEKIAAGYRRADCLRLKADVYNHHADTLHEMAAEAAYEALKLDPRCLAAYDELNSAMKGFDPDWYKRSHHRLIDRYKEIIKKHPDCRPAYIWLLGSLIDDGRLDEAREFIEGLAKIDNTYRTPLWRAKLLWAEGKRDESREAFRKMLADYPDEWGAYMEAADHAAGRGELDEAIEYAKTAAGVQKAPRFVDPYETLAKLYELKGDNAKAIEALEEELRVLKTDFDTEQGETADCVRREIARLKMKK